MAKKFRDLVARKPASWHAAVGERKQELLAAKPLHTGQTPSLSSRISGANARKDDEAKE